MTERQDVTHRVREVLAQVLDVPIGEIGPALSTSTSAAWTSLNHLMLVSQLENEFGVVFSNQEIKDLTSYSAILTTLERRLDSAS